MTCCMLANSTFIRVLPMYPCLHAVNCTVLLIFDVYSFHRPSVQLSVPMDRIHDMVIIRCSQEIKEMLPEGVLSIAIRADFWQPQKNERKAELIKYWHQRGVLDRLNI